MNAEKIMVGQKYWVTCKDGSQVLCEADEGYGDYRDLVNEDLGMILWATPKNLEGLTVTRAAGLVAVLVERGVL